ncbi:hypothetical protein CCUS01_07429 [Colletotrichum cuscutae]|uniref:Uncharacterized protein n=1 Tax=Colletotrichum cuscutae TaxID=1209917 RepID=A0AAI9UWJ2_9PEZI|nr:hypothetical protein CCUS01_07429 [Colletotrichum cuscutae]
MKEEQKNPAYVKEQHPFGRMPVIQDAALIPIQTNQI